MIYLGWFSFDAENSEDKTPWEGHFNMIVEAKNVNEASEKFMNKLLDKKSRNKKDPETGFNSEF